VDEPDDFATDRLDLVKVLARGLDIIAAFVPRNDWLSNAQIADRCNLPRPTVSRLTAVLSGMGLLIASARQGTYRLGPSALTLGYDGFSRSSPWVPVRPILRELAERYGGAVVVAERDGLTMVGVEAHQREDGLIGIRIFQGSRLPLLTSAVGRAWYYAASPTARSEIDAMIEERYGERAPALVVQLRREAAACRSDGIYVGYGNLEGGVNGLGVALEVSGKSSSFALGWAAAASLFTNERIDGELADALAAARRRIEEIMTASRLTLQG
jgi:IclR family transcriptional regulator, positive regulator for flagellar biogenesis